MTDRTDTVRVTVRVDAVALTNLEVRRLAYQRLAAQMDATLLTMLDRACRSGIPVIALSLEAVDIGMRVERASAVVTGDLTGYPGHPLAEKTLRRIATGLTAHSVPCLCGELARTTGVHSTETGLHSPERCDTDVPNVHDEEAE